METELYNLLKNRGYNLVIDEALAVVDPYDDIKRQDLDMLLRDRKLSVDDNGALRWNHEAWPRYDGKFASIIPLCDNGNLVQVREGLLMWTFPHEFLDGFNDIFIATYMFEGQNMANYLRSHGVPYTHMALVEGQLVPHGDFDGMEIKRRLAERIYIVDDDFRNDIGTRKHRAFPLSAGWFKSRNKRHDDIRQLKRNLEWFFKAYGQGAFKNMWATFKDRWSWVKSNGPLKAAFS